MDVIDNFAIFIPDEPASPQKTYYAAMVGSSRDLARQEYVEAPAGGANLIGSRMENGLHVVQLDLDGPHTYVPSSTMGHGHLSLRKNNGGGLTWHDYEKVLKVLHEVGILEHGYYDNAVRRQQTFLRPPGVKKGEEKQQAANFARHELLQMEEDLK